MSNTLDFSADSPLLRALADWWRGLDDNRGARAELRRCGSVDEVAMTAAFARLCHSLQGHFAGEHGWQDRLAAIAGLLSHLRENTPGKSLPEQMAEGSPPVVSELRFRRLLQCDRQELYPALLRVLRQLNYRADLPGLCRDVYFWGDKVKKRWAYAYFPNVRAA